MSTKRSLAGIAPHEFFVVVVDKEEDIHRSGLAAIVIGGTVTLHELLQGISLQMGQPGYIFPGVTEIDIILLLFLLQPVQQPLARLVRGGSIPENVQRNAN